ncbi:MAG: hypothetical protein A2133_08375 [Actinobacteria bacterium RBG_16_64_13]|nr:MAG: hypothetical protein A2133_08375 [Actinobacteria bacterium RBG_16_64_13]
MDSTEFTQIRHRLSKTQAEMASLLGVSSKGVQSFEQGWRSIPLHVERQALFLLYLKQRPLDGTPACWERRGCGSETRARCIAWEVHAGDLCWFIGGTMCQGVAQGSWKKKMQLCRQCEVFRSLVPTSM